MRGAGATGFVGAGGGRDNSAPKGGEHGNDYRLSEQEMASLSAGSFLFEGVNLLGPRLAL